MHADILQIVQLAEDTHLAELADAGDEQEAEILPHACLLYTSDLVVQEYDYRVHVRSNRQLWHLPSSRTGDGLVSAYCTYNKSHRYIRSDVWIIVVDRNNALYHYCIPVQRYGGLSWYAKRNLSVSDCRYPASARSCVLRQELLE